MQKDNLRGKSKVIFMIDVVVLILFYLTNLTNNIVG